MFTAVAEESELRGAGRFEELYREHAPTAQRVAYLMTGDDALAQDLVQEAFLKLSGRFLDLRNPEAFGAYLRRTVVNLAHSHFRRKRVERNHLEREKGERRRPGTEPVKKIDNREMMWQALRKLNARQRAAIVSRYYLDLPDEETAKMLGVRPATVRSLIFRSLEVLRDEVNFDG